MSVPPFVNVFCGSWNVNGKEVKEDLSPWLIPKRGTKPDLYVIGFQEFDLTPSSFQSVDEQRFRKWDQSILDTISKIGPFTQVARQQLVGILIVIYAKEGIAHLIKELDSDLVGTGYEGIFGNKGAVGVRFRIGNDTFCFINSHLNAHAHNVERRKLDYLSITSRMVFSPQTSSGTNKPQQPMTLPENFVSDDRAEESSLEVPLIEKDKKLKDGELSLFDHDHLVWIGDLNYRIDLERTELMAAITSEDWDSLIKADQLIREINSKSVFENFKEGALAFLPTYKFDSGTDNYDSSKKMRLPAFCDRVLWRDDSAIQSITYDGHMELKISDHKPISAILKIKLQPVVPPTGEPSPTSRSDPTVKEPPRIRPPQQPRGEAKPPSPRRSNMLPISVLLISLLITIWYFYF